MCDVCLQPDDDVKNDWEKRKFASQSAGMQYIRELIREAEGRITSVKAGQSYELNVLQCKVNMTTLGPILLLQWRHLNVIASQIYMNWKKSLKFWQWNGMDKLSHILHVVWLLVHAGTEVSLC